jgi:hypothetical protein
MGACATPRITLQSWASEVYSRSSGVKVKVPAGLRPSGGSNETASGLNRHPSPSGEEPCGPRGHWLTRTVAHLRHLTIIIPAMSPLPEYCQVLAIRTQSSFKAVLPGGLLVLLVPGH